MPEQLTERVGTANTGAEVLITKAVASLPASYWRQVAALHRQEISAGFISSLNPKFIESIYRSIARSKQAFLLSATDANSGELLGFICGSTNTKSTFIQVLLRSGIGLIFSLLPNVFSFRTIKKMYETVRYASTGASETASASEVLPRAEILNFCVNGRIQGRGIGRLLFTALCSEFRQRGVATIKIVTGEYQISAQRFYHAAHARLAGNLEIHENSKSVVFLYDIN